MGEVISENVLRNWLKRIAQVQGYAGLDATPDGQQNGPQSTSDIADNPMRVPPIQVSAVCGFIYTLLRHNIKGVGS